MYISKLFNRSQKEPPFRNPYIYLKEQELLKLQKQKEYEELKFVKECKANNKSKDKKITLALDNLRYAASCKMFDTRKKLSRKIDVSENISPTESLKRSSKEASNNDRTSRPWCDTRNAFRFLTIHLSKSSVSSHIGSVCTKNSGGSDFSDSILHQGFRSKCQSTYTTDSTNVSICNSIGIQSKESMIQPFRAIANTELHSTNYLATEYCPSGNKTLSYKQIEHEMSTSTTKPPRDINNSLSLSSNATRDSLGNNSNTSNNFETHLSGSKFCYQNGSIIMPKANCTDQELTFFRKRYHL